MSTRRLWPWLLCVVASAFAAWLSRPAQPREIHVAPATGARPRLLPNYDPSSRPADPHTPTAPESQPAASPSKKTRVRWSSTTTTTLLVGIDRRPDAKGAGLADTILLASLDDSEQSAGIISIPRDLWVTIPGYGEDRINVIPAVARRTKRNSLKLFSRVIEDTLGLPVSHGVFVDLSVFERVVDAVGGVEVMVPCPIVDSFHDSRVEGGRRRLELATGRALLDGPTAAMYVRSRHGRSDFGRARRQQAVLLGLRDRILSNGGLLRVPEVYAAVEESMFTDLRRYELLDLARRVLSLERGALHGIVLSPPLTIAHATDDGKAVLLPNRDAIAKAIRALPTAQLPGEPLNAPCPAADAALRGR